MEDLGLVGDLAAVSGAAVAGGALARVLRLPPVLGYVGAGLALGPHTPGPVGDVEQVRTVADLGVALLMFTLGIRFSLRELMAVRGLAVLGGLGQIVVVIGLGAGLGLGLGLSAEEALLLGAVVSISSTMVALRLLEDRGLIGAPAGRIGVVFALTQDLAVVPLMIMIPVMGGSREDVLLEMGLAAGKGVALLVGVWLVGTLVVPRVLVRVGAVRSRELFLLTVVALALGTASVSFAAGLSLAFGAFLAGIVVSESEYAHRTLAEVFPLREVFAVIFFVAMGMLIDPMSFRSDTEIVVGAAVVGVIGKALLVTVIAVAFGYTAKAALAAGLALGNMGEFSFILVEEGLDEGIFDEGLRQAALASVLLSVVVSPLLFMGHGPLHRQLSGLPRLRARAVEHVPDPEGMAQHSVVCGFDEAGQEVASALTARGFRYVVIDEDPSVFRRLRSAGVPCILGDPALPIVLEQAGLERARVLVVNLTDLAQGEAAVAAARQINPKLDIVARGWDEESHRRLQRAGASEVVHAGLEVGLEFARHTLHRFGVSSQEVQALLARRRRDYHGLG